MKNLAQPTNKLIMIGNRLVFAASVDQRYFSSIKDGDPATIYLRAVDGTPFEGRVVRISPVVSGAVSGSKSGGQADIPFTFVASLDIDAKGQKLASGMNGYCLFSREIETLAIPQSALMRYSGGEGVIGVVDPDNRVQFVPVAYSIGANIGGMSPRARQFPNWQLIGRFFSAGGTGIVVTLLMNWRQGPRIAEVRDGLEVRHQTPGQQH